LPLLITVGDIGGLNLEWIQSILSADARQILHIRANKRKDPAHGRVFTFLQHSSLPVVMMVVTMMVTCLGRGYSACKHCQCNNCEHQVTNLHGEILLEPGGSAQPGSSISLSFGWQRTVNSFPQPGNLSLP